MVVLGRWILRVGLNFDFYSLVGLVFYCLKCRRVDAGRFIEQLYECKITIHKW